MNAIIDVVITVLSFLGGLFESKKITANDTDITFYRIDTGDRKYVDTDEYSNLGFSYNVRYEGTYLISLDFQATSYNRTFTPKITVTNSAGVATPYVLEGHYVSSTDNSNVWNISTTLTLSPGDVVTVGMIVANSTGYVYFDGSILGTME